MHAVQYRLPVPSEPPHTPVSHDPTPQPAVHASVGQLSVDPP